MADDKGVDDAGGGQETVESLKEKLAEAESTISSLTAESTKHKTLRRSAEKERDDLKKQQKTTDKTNEDYKTLWEETNSKLVKANELSKKSSIETALTAQFGRAKVASDRVDAALKLVDHSLIEWDAEAGVDGKSVTAAVQKLKSGFPFLFETTVDKTDVKNPGDASASGSSIPRSVFDGLSSTDKVAKIKAGVKITD